MRTNPFESQLERLARTLTDQFGVDVIFRGDQAYTDGRTIVLPTLPEPLEDALERMMVGYLDHEMAHVAFTDFKQVRRFNRKHRGFEAMLNVVEDALIEKLAMQRWPGVRANLDALFHQVRDRVEQCLPQAGSFRRFCTAVYLKLSQHQQLLGLDAELRGYEDLLDRFSHVATTRDSARLSEQLLKRWLQRRPRSQRAAPSPDTPTAPESQSSSPQDLGDPPNCDAAKGEKPQHNAGNSSVAEIPGLSEEDLDAEQIAALTEGARGSLIAESVNERLVAAVENIDPMQQYRPFTRQYDRIDIVPTACESQVQRLLERNGDAVRRLRRGLANALRSAEKRWWREEQARGSLSPRTLYRLGMDGARMQLFRTRTTVQGRKTAVSIVLDASGSMSTGKMEVARDALRALLEALHDLRIPTEAFTFTTGDELDVNAAANQAGIPPNEIYRRFSRFGNLEIGLIKRFEDPVKLALQRLPTIRGTGLTPLGEAMEIGASRLIVRRESRKILLVITDGHAGCESGAAAAHRHAQQVAKQITRAGIELIGVGIQDQSLCAIVADTIVVSDITELPTQLCKLLGRTLKKGLQHVG